MAIIRKCVFAFIILSCLALLFHSALFADEIFLKNGNRLSGKIIQENSELIVFRISGGQIKIRKSEIRKIQIEVPSAESGQPAVSASVPKTEKPAGQPAPERFDFWKNLTEKIKEIIKRQSGHPAGAGVSSHQRPVGISRLTEMKTAEWFMLIVKKAFGSQFQKQLSREWMTRFSFFVLVGLGGLSFVITWLVSFLRSRCSVMDAFLFQAKLILSCLILILLIKGVFPLLLALIPWLGSHMAAVETACWILTVISIILAYFYLAKTSLELVPFKAVLLLVLLGIFLAAAKFLFDGFLSQYFHF